MLGALRSQKIVENSRRNLEVEWRKKDRLMKTLTREVFGTDRHPGFDTTGYIFRGDGDKKDSFYDLGYHGLG